MKNISQKELNKILEKHKLWIKNEEDGKRADLKGIDLSYTYLSNIDLSYVYLKDTDLKRADLSNANLTSANLIDADLRGADLRDANLWNVHLSWANLYNANLYNVDLRDADLYNTNLRGVNLRGADLRNTNLRGADLRDADLRDANLWNTDLRGANLKNIKTNMNTIGYNLACPEKGSFIAYKKTNRCIVELLIPEDAKRSSATTSKCRCDKAKVLEITNINTNEKVRETCSFYDVNFIYKVGEIVSVDNFDEDRWNECSTGIHFFMNKENALNY